MLKKTLFVIFMTILVIIVAIIVVNIVEAFLEDFGTSKQPQPYTSDEVMAISEYRIEKLIEDLNDSKKTNAKARKELVKIGSKAVPTLMENITELIKSDESEASIRVARAIARKELDKIAPEDMAEVMKRDKDRSKAPIRVARALRVLNEMNCSTEAIPLCEKLLLGKTGFLDEVVDNEALRFLYANFNKKSARDIYYNLAIDTQRCFGVLDRRHTGRKLIIFEGIQLMIRHNDPRAEDILIKWLEALPYKAERLTVRVLSKNGYSSDYDNYYVDMAGFKQRMRIGCMKLLKRLKSRKALPVIEKFLKSEHADERELALVILEELNPSGGQ